MPPELPPESVEHVKRAGQLLDRGLPDRADFELDRVDPRFRLHPDVLEVRIAFDVFLHRFEHAVTLARILEHYYPERKGVMHRQMSRFPHSPKPRDSIWDLV